MSETKFTPAPWSAKGGWMIVDKGERLIAQFESLNDELSNCNTPESFANANLIACAPEMYAMLDKISDELLDAGGVWNCALAKDIEKLLAKARGEA